jgi:hypothetical protein
LTAIVDLADLFVTASEYAKRADFAHLFPRFVALTENQISQALRFEGQSTTVTLTADAQGRVTLPADFREVRSVRMAGGNRRQLSGGTLAILDSTFDENGTPQAFAIGGGFLNLRPRQATDIELTYLAGVPRLTAAAPSNAILLRYPDCYLHGVVHEVMKWAADADAAAASLALFKASLDAAVADNERRSFSYVRYRRAGVTP